MMPNLFETFQDYDLDQIEMIAEQWGVEDDVSFHENEKEQIVDLLKNADLFLEITQSLPSLCREALQEILNNGGKIPRDRFTRVYGEIREMGASAREKERPDRNPQSFTENLYYKGLIGLSFFDEKGEAKEYFYLPDEFHSFIDPTIKSEELQRNNFSVVTDINNKNIRRVSDKFLDEICIYLAALRGSIPMNEYGRILPIDNIPFLNSLLQSLNIINANRAILDTEKLGSILVGKRSKVFSMIRDHWLGDANINELKLIHKFRFEGKWKNDPVKTRMRIKHFISKLEEKKWYPISEFINWIYKKHPDFMRSGGEYDSWFIKDISTDNYLSGFGNWHQIEGVLIRYLLSGPFFWMGIIEHLIDQEFSRPTAFRKSEWSDAKIPNEELDYQSISPASFTLRRNGEIVIPLNSQREMHYQVARFCEWRGVDNKHYRYMINYLSIKRAQDQGITKEQIKKLINKHADKPIPKNIFKAIDNWGNTSLLFQIEKHIIVRVGKKSLLDQLEKSQLKKFILERISPTTIIIPEKNIEKFEEALAEKGYFSERIAEV